MNKKLIVPALVVLVLSGGVLAYTQFKSEGKTINSSSEVVQDSMVVDQNFKTTDSTLETEAPENILAAANCGITKSVTEGPYYVSGTQALVDGNLNYDGFSGTPIKITGRVLAGANDDAPVITNAKIEFWQADDEGSYHPNANGAATRYTDEQIALRGYVTTNELGQYTLNSIYPGYYEGRARHIHVKISADGYTSIVTQLIFQPKSGDNQTYSTDSIAQSLGSCYLMEMSNETPQTGAFDFRLNG
jgi:protocatechuate 3,4-dioxygenase beta subunit